MPDPGERQRPVVVDLRPSPPYSAGTFDPERADPLEAVDYRLGDLRVAFDLEGVDVGFEEVAQLLEKALALLHGRRIEVLAAGESDPAEVCRETTPCRSSATSIRFRAPPRRPQACLSETLLDRSLLLCDGSVSVVW